MSTIRRDRGHALFPGEDSSAPDEPPWLDVPRGSLSIVESPPRTRRATSRRWSSRVVLCVSSPWSIGPQGGHRLDAFEVIVVDDGSTDGTRAVLRRLVEVYPEIRPISLAANVGQSAATIAGFRIARGDWVGVLDADLQNPPEDLAKLWDLLCPDSTRLWGGGRLVRIVGRSGLISWVANLKVRQYRSRTIDQG